jgi:DNA-binding CsgD family transcriptional regulator
VLGPLSYALAAVKSASNPTFVLQAICRERRVDQADRDLLLVFAQLSAALINEPGASELLNRCRGRAGSAPSKARARQRAAARSSGSSEPADRGCSPPELERLTVRQRDVLAHALTGATYAAIADRLGLNVARIKSHMQAILRKLDLHSRAQLIARYATVISRDQRNP